CVLRRHLDNLATLAEKYCQFSTVYCTYSCFSNLVVGLPDLAFRSIYAYFCHFGAGYYGCGRLTMALETGAGGAGADDRGIILYIGFNSRAHLPGVALAHADGGGGKSDSFAIGDARNDLRRCFSDVL